MRVAVLGAGGPAGVNVCRALADAGHDVVGIDGNEAHLIWCKPFCVETHVGGTELLSGIADVLHAQPEAQVQWLADNRSSLDGLTLLPDARVIARTQDKFETGLEWRRAGLREDRICLVQDERGIGEALSWLGARPFWFRARRGAGAKGAILARTYDEARYWFRFWQARDLRVDFLAEAYLPGRDFCWTSLWHEGTLIAAFARERLEWMYPHLTPSGRTGTPSIAVTIHEEAVSVMAREAVLTLDDPHGIYAVDLVEDEAGTPRPTEINAGRWPTTSPLYSELGVNLPDLHVRLAAGEDVEPLGDNVYPAGIVLSRHIDCGHVFSSVALTA